MGTKRNQEVFDCLAVDGFKIVLDETVPEPDQTYAHPLDPIIPIWYTCQAGPTAMAIHLVASQIALSSCLRDKAPFLLEEFARHTGLGFKPIRGINHPVVNGLGRVLQFMPGYDVAPGVLSVPQSMPVPEKHRVLSFVGVQRELHDRWMNG